MTLNCVRCYKGPTIRQSNACILLSQVINVDQALCYQDAPPDKLFTVILILYCTPNRVFSTVALSRSSVSHWVTLLYNLISLSSPIHLLHSNIPTVSFNSFNAFLNRLSFRNHKQLLCLNIHIFSSHSVLQISHSLFVSS